MALDWGVFLICLNTMEKIRCITETACSYRSPLLAWCRKRGVHASSYDKNEDEPVGPTAVPDNVIDAKADKYYWGPHPTTGVFGPAAETGASSVAAGGAKTAAGPSALDETVWYRPLEDVDKTPHA